MHLAVDEEQRRRRLATLRVAQAGFVAVPVDQDAWIAATARALGVALFSHDAGFEVVADLDRVLI